MVENSNIAWTDNTWNPWQGCKKVSPGCLNCYMFRDKKRFKQQPGNIHRSSNATFNKPLHWKDPAKVFVCSWSDFFIEEADEWRAEAWEIIRKCRHLTFQLLTKRPENIAARLPEGWPFENVWLGVTAENQEMADLRIPQLLAIPAAVRFVSVEPMLGPVELRKIHAPLNSIFSEVNALTGRQTDMGRPCRDTPSLDWVICGGESGPNARPMEPCWADRLMLQCWQADVPFFMKQMSGTTKKQREAIPDHINTREFPGDRTRSA